MRTVASDSSLVDPHLGFRVPHWAGVSIGFKKDSLPDRANPADPEDIRSQHHEPLTFLSLSHWSERSSDPFLGGTAPRRKYITCSWVPCSFDDARIRLTLTDSGSLFVSCNDARNPTMGPSIGACVQTLCPQSAVSTGF